MQTTTGVDGGRRKTGAALTLPLRRFARRCLDGARVLRDMSRALRFNVKARRGERQPDSKTLYEQLQEISR